MSKPIFDQVVEALDSMWAASGVVVGKLHARDEILDIIQDVKANTLKDAVARIQGQDYPRSNGTIAVEYAVELILDGLEEE